MEEFIHRPSTKENATQNPSLNKKQCSIDYIPKILSLKSSLHSHPMVVAPLEAMVMLVCALINQNPEITVYTWSLLKVSSLSLWRKPSLHYIPFHLNTDPKDNKTP